MPDTPPASREDEKPLPPGPAEPREAGGITDLVDLANSPGLVPPELSDVSFPISLRGYDREAVDAYIKRVNQIVAELEVSRSPQSAVKLALDRVGEQTAGVLQRAREAAEELTSTTLAEAEHTSRRTRVEAAELMERADRESREMVARATEESEELLAHAHQEAAQRLNDAEARIASARATAEARLEELEREVEEAREERRQVLEEIRATAADLDRFAQRAERELRPGEEGDQASGSDDGATKLLAPSTAAAGAGNADGHGPVGGDAPDSSEQPTVIAPAIESAAGAIEPEQERPQDDAKKADAATERRRPRRPPQPLKQQRRQPSEAGRGTRS